MLSFPRQMEESPLPEIRDCEVQTTPYATRRHYPQQVASVPRWEAETPLEITVSLKDAHGNLV